MLAQARRRPDVEWVLGDQTTAARDHEFDLVVMTGHAFHVLLGDDELRDALDAIGAALVPGGRFAFETRDPGRSSVDPVDARQPDRVHRRARDLAPPRTRRRGARHRYLVRFRTAYLDPRRARPAVSRGALRFLDADPVGARAGSRARRPGLEVPAGLG